MGKDLQKLYWLKCLGRSREGSNCRCGEASHHSASLMPMKGQSEGRVSNCSTVLTKSQPE